MYLREDQIELMERIEPGLVWKWHVDPETDSKIIHLRELDLVQAREDIKHDLLCLTESGKSVLDLERQKRREQAEQKRREEAAEAVRLQERREDIENAERRYRGQNKVTIEAAFISGSLGFVLGVVAEHRFEIIHFFSSFLYQQWLNIFPK